MSDFSSVSVDLGSITHATQRSLGSGGGVPVMVDTSALIPDPAMAASIARKEEALARLRACAAGDPEVPGASVLADLLILMGYL